MNSKYLAAAVVVATMFVAGTSSARKNEDGEKDCDHKRGPPQAAVDACADAADGASCTFESRRGELSGTCLEVRDGSIACVPEGHRGRGPRGPSEDSDVRDEPA